MPQSRFEWHERIKSVEREYWAVRIAVDQLSTTAVRNSTILGAGPQPRDLVAANENLEGTYLLRMFAEFETAIRSYWRTVKPKARTRVEVLLDQVGHKLAVPARVIREVHAVREYRNQLIHDREQEVAAVSVEDARHWLATYLARLPIEWGD